MNRRRTGWIGIAAFVALALLSTGCDDDNNPLNPVGGGGSLTSTNANPSDGNATFSSPNPTYTPSAEPGLDAVFASETVGSVGHEIGVYWHSGTSTIQRVEHFWGPGGPLSGSTRCLEGVNACDPAKVSINTSARTVTFTNLVLTDSTSGSATSTLNGVVSY